MENNITFKNIYHRRLKIPDEKIEELRTMLINEYKEHSPISTTKVIKLITDNHDDKCTEEKRSDISKEIAQIYANNNIISEHILKENKLYPTYIKCYFTSIGEAYKSAGIKATYTKPHHITKEEFINRFTKLIPEFSKNNIPFSLEELRKCGLTHYYINMYFGDFYSLLKSFNISI